uniref:Uncharacterized protein n=1 Tax=Utricularia reniformis TaxID=192314 RepID=A0A1Y0AZJ9_9LAMI|nr:hypothetical protein AEK19_MT0282 [Utricularia reniformis]ART30558.1 hypothetical protein AEK19_MT0282 [Utricularia reniformis]
MISDLAYFTGDCCHSLCLTVLFIALLSYFYWLNSKSPKTTNAPSHSRTSSSCLPHGESIPAHSMSDSLLWIQLGPILLLPCGFGIGIYPAYSCPSTSAIRSALAMPILFCAIHPAACFQDLSLTYRRKKERKEIGKAVLLPKVVLLCNLRQLVIVHPFLRIWTPSPWKKAIVEQVRAPFHDFPTRNHHSNKIHMGFGFRFLTAVRSDFVI